MPPKPQRLKGTPPTQPTGSISKHFPKKTPVPPLDVTDVDDATVRSGRNSPKLSTKASASRELVVKLEFSSARNPESSTIAGNALKILHRISDKFKREIQIYNNEGNLVTEFNTTPGIFLKEFYLHSTTRGKDKKKHKSFFVFRIVTGATLKQLRTDPDVSSLLNNLSARLTLHPWTEDITDVVSLGWFLGPLPKYTMAQEMTTKLRQLIASQANISEQKIPRFHCQMEMITTTCKQRRVACQAYGLTVQRKDATQLSNIIHRAFAHPTSDFMFILYRQRYSHPEVFAKAILRQSEREANMRIVAVKGLNPEYMPTFESVLRDRFPDITAVYSTPTTSSTNSFGTPIGRYNLLCHVDHFVSLAQQLGKELPSLYLTHVAQHGGTPVDTDEPVAVTSRYPGSSRYGDGDSELSEGSLSTRNSFYSSCESALEEYDLDEALQNYELPASISRDESSKSPTGVSPLTMSSPTNARTYAQVVGGGGPPLPTVSEERLQQLETENAQLRAQISQLAQQMTALIHTLTSAKVLELVDATQAAPSPSPFRKKTRTSISPDSDSTGLVTTPSTHDDPPDKMQED